jgi:NAD(P)-dependent dehydrogenase (short-subunit alcohol dehydrogenase family)
MTKTVFITGASAGLGRAIAEAFGREGYRIGLIARNGEALAETIRPFPQSAWAAADVADPAQLEAATQSLITQLGPPDIWINNAMATIFSRFGDIQPEEFARAINVTLLGSVYGLQLALKLMREKGGHIIQVGSALAYRAIPLQAPYCAAKLGVRGAVDSLRCEIIHDKLPIHLTMVHMPAMNTPQFDWARRHIDQHPQPVPPIYSPEACAKAFLWTAKHPQRREVWVGKPTFEAILGNKFFPALMDYAMAKQAFENQFEKPAAEKDSAGNLFAAVASFHKTEGHFTSRQKTEVFWMGTSWVHEIALLAICILAFILLLLGVARL